MNQKILIENIIKNVILVILLILFYFPLKKFLVQLNMEDYDSILIVSTLLIMAFLFADYAFTYKFANLKNSPERFLAHLTTGIIMFGTGALLECTVVSLNLQIANNFFLLELIIVLFYISLVLYDFFDLNDALKNLHD